MPNIKLHFVEGLNYTCTNCGRCCQAGWRKIYVGAEKAEEMRGTDLFAQKVREGYTPLELDQDSEIRLGTAGGSACAFRDESGCEYHALYGGIKKPVPCQLYPFTLVNTPEGHFVSPAFSCPAVLAGMGPSLESHGEDLIALLHDNESVPQFPALASLSEETDIKWGDYLPMESRLSEQFDQMDPVGFCLNAACAILMDSGMASFQEESPLLETAMSFLPQFVLHSVSLGEFPLDQEGRQEFLPRLLAGELPASLRCGAPLPEFTYRKPRDLVTREAIARYCRAQFQGKKLLIGPSITTRLLMLATGLSTLLYYQDALATSEGERHVSFAHLEKAFEIIEDDFMTHSFDLEPLLLEFERALRKTAT
jgi:Fe-S-cluster containining protein